MSQSLWRLHGETEGLSSLFRVPLDAHVGVTDMNGTHPRILLAEHPVYMQN